MKKTILTTAAILVVNLFYGQWTTNNYVDDFGEPTENSYDVMITDGTFSNSATQNSKLSLKFINNKKDESLLIYVYEYGSKLANDIEGNFETVRLKDPEGIVHTLNKVFFAKSGVLLISKENYKKISNALIKKGNFMIIFNRTTKYSTSSYKSKFIIN